MSPDPAGRRAARAARELAGSGAGLELRVDPIACTGHGSCAELLPELIEPDEWGYPVLAPGPVPARLLRPARRAAAACPVLALTLAPARPAAGGAVTAAAAGPSEAAQRKPRGRA